MSIQVSQHLPEKKIILNDISALGFDLDMNNKYGTLIYNKKKNAKIFFFISFY